MVLGVKKEIKEFILNCKINEIPKFEAIKKACDHFGRQSNSLVLKIADAVFKEKDINDFKKKVPEFLLLGFEEILEYLNYSKENGFDQTEAIIAAQKFFGLAALKEIEDISRQLFEYAMNRNDIPFKDKYIKISTKEIFNYAVYCKARGMSESDCFNDTLMIYGLVSNKIIEHIINLLYHPQSFAIGSNF
jgi:hypothetical protein